VEAGKKAAAAILQLQQQIMHGLGAASAPLDLNTLAGTISAEDQIETIYKILRHMAANGRGIVLDGDPADPSTLSVSLRS